MDYRSGFTIVLKCIARPKLKLKTQFETEIHQSHVLFSVLNLLSLCVIGDNVPVR